jgi:hypothetical protein
MVIPNEGKLLWLTWAITGNPPTLESFIVKLFKNNYTPVDASTASDFTEATFTGYAAITIARTAFSAPAIVSDVAYSSVSGYPTYTCTAGGIEVCYGWYMVGASSGKVLAAQRFDNARSISAGAVEKLNPFIFGLDTLT